MALQVKTATPLQDVQEILRTPGEVDIAVAFITASGLTEVRALLTAKLESGQLIRLLFDLTDGATDPSALWELVELADHHQGLLQLRAYVSNPGILHAKLYIAHSDLNSLIMTGSANLSAAAFHHNQEHGMQITGTADDEVIRKTRLWFDDLWASDNSFHVDREAARLYEMYCGRRRAVAERAQRRSRAAWNNLARHLAEGPPQGFQWPSVSAAFIVGAIAARGKLEPAHSKAGIQLMFRPQLYKGRRITVQGVSYDAATVLPEIPAAIAMAAERGLPGCAASVEGMTVNIDFTKAPEILDALEGVFAPSKDCDAFHLPTGLIGTSDGVVMEFLSGFAAACALLTDQTSMPRDARTGLPGLMMVWLRPKQGNIYIFDQLQSLVTRRLGWTAYAHRRRGKEPHLKIRCDDFVEIGFGIEWWDQLLRAGATYNQSHFTQSIPMQSGLPPP